MLKYWKWALRMKLVCWVVGVKMGRGGAVVPMGWAPLRAAIWAILYTLAVFNLVGDSSSAGDCYEAWVRETYKIYDVGFVIAMFVTVGIATNVFCVSRFTLRNVARLINKSIAFHKRVTYALGQSDGCFDKQIKWLMLYTFVSPFFNPVYESFDCSRGKLFSRWFWVFFLTQCLLAVVALPGPAMTTVFFLTLESVNQSFALINHRINNLVASKSPKPSIGETPLNCDRFQAKKPLNARYIYSLRKIHDETIIMSDEIMQFFQADILAFFIMAFYHNILFNYSIVVNGITVFKSKETTQFMFINIVSVVSLLVNLWAICAGPSRIQDKQRELIISVSRLTTVPCDNSDVAFEVKMFQLQSRNYKSSFEVYGMFKLNYSLLFTMCASITSYIVVLIQFTIDIESQSGTSGVAVTSNTTLPLGLNMTALRGVNTTMESVINITATEE